MARRLHKLHRLPEIDTVDFSVSREINKTVQEARETVALDILKMARGRGVLSSDEARRSAITKTLSTFKEMRDEIEDEAHGGAERVSKIAGRFARADIGKDEEPATERMGLIWDNLSPDTEKGVGGPLSDTLRHWASSNLHKAVRDSWREGTAKGWSQQKIEAAVRSKWEAFASEMVSGQPTDKAGRKVNVKASVDSLVRTVNAKVFRELYFDSVIKSGSDLVIIENADDKACKKCVEYDGVIISISGNDDRFPSYEEALKDGWGHINCRCAAEIVDAEQDAQAIIDQAD